MSKYQDMEIFQAEKEKILARDDLSKIGHVDKEIKPLVDEINSKGDYCTTSSCAGRITLIERRSPRKIDSTWLVAEHNPIEVKLIKDRLKSEHDVWLMMETYIIHIFCRTLEAAGEMLKICKKVGLKRSGITQIDDKIMIESMGNEKVETLVVKDGKTLIDDEYLKVLVEECNTRLMRNRDKVGKLLEEIKRI